MDTTQDQTTSSSQFGDYSMYETEGCERIVLSPDNIRKLYGDKVKCHVGLISAKFDPLGTGFVFVYKSFLIVVTASHVVIDPVTKKFLRNLVFTCGQNGTR